MDVNMDEMGNDSDMERIRTNTAGFRNIALFA